jgi:hypothetical protein
MKKICFKRLAKIFILFYTLGYGHYGIYMSDSVVVICCLNTDRVVRKKRKEKKRVMRREVLPFT